MKITVFTPTYNRAYIINNLYQSLLRQTFTDFEWLIIDDGSTDQTEDMVSEWQKECDKFKIRYYKISNGGKSRAINKALDLAKGSLFLVVDSDDYLTDDALEKVDIWEQQLDSNRYCAVSGNLGLTKESTPNYLFESKYHDGTAMDRYKSVNGERAIAFYTEIHRQYKYPEFEGEKFITEAVAWNRMANDGYKIRFYNDIICIYEYQEDGLTKAGNELFLNNPQGYGLWLKEKCEFENESMLEKMKMRYSLVCELESRYSVNKIAKCLNISSVEILMLIGLRKVIEIIRKR